MDLRDRPAPTREFASEHRPGQGQHWLNKMLVAALSILLTLVLLEVAFRVAGYEPIYNVYSKPEAFWRHDPLLGWTLEPGANGTYVGPRPFPIQFRTPIHINSLGLRGPEIRPVARGGERILVLGDSMTAGFEVPEDRTYSALAQKLLRRRSQRPVQVINGGVRGYGTDQVLLFYRQRLRRLHPDVVVYHTTSNDPDDVVTLHRVRRPFGKPAFAPRPDGSLDRVGVPVPSYPLCAEVRLDARFRVRTTDTVRTRALCWLQTRLADHSALFSFVATRIEQNPDLLQALHRLGSPQRAAEDSATPWPRHAYRLTSLLIEKLAAEVTDDGARFVLLAQQDDLDPIHIGARLPAKTAHVVRLDRALGPHPGENVRFPIDGHYNELGHRRVGILLARELSRLLAR